MEWEDGTMSVLSSSEVERGSCGVSDDSGADATSKLRSSPEKEGC